MGPNTGEISVGMLKSIGVQYVIIGHSERRQYFEETNEIVRDKVLQVLESGLKAIYCCGEDLEVRDAGNHVNFVQSQLEASLGNLTTEQMESVIIAYEPIWAIGTGKTATPQQAQDMHASIRGWLVSKFGENTASQTSILYGGSCKPSNAAELFAQEDVDGGLIGGASLNAEDFLAIAQSFS